MSRGASPAPRLHDPPRLPEPLAALPRPEFHRFPGDAFQGPRSPIGFMWAYVSALYWFMRAHLGQPPPSLVEWLACRELVLVLEKMPAQRELMQEASIVAFRDIHDASGAPQGASPPLFK